MQFHYRYSTFIVSFSFSLSLVQSNSIVCVSTRAVCLLFTLSFRQEKAPAQRNKDNNSIHCTRSDFSSMAGIFLALPCYIASLQINKAVWKFWYENTRDFCVNKLATCHGVLFLEMNFRSVILHLKARECGYFQDMRNISTGYSV